MFLPRIPKHVTQPRNGNAFACCRNTAVKRCLSNSEQGTCPAGLEASLVGGLEPSLCRSDRGWLQIGCKFSCNGSVKEEDLGFQVDLARLIILARKQRMARSAKKAEDILCGWRAVTLEPSQGARIKIKYLMKQNKGSFICTASLLIA